MAQYKKGYLAEKGYFVMLRNVGEAEHEKTKLKYTLANTKQGEPVIISHQSKQRWILDWPTLIEMAINEGVDDDE